jgi:hypothetical protein
MTDIAGTDPLQALRRRFFGSNGDAMPPAFLLQLSRLVNSEDATLGIRQSATERTALWLNGRVLGRLGSTGTTDTNAEISGVMFRLDDIAQLDIEVKIKPIAGGWSDDPGASCRELKINGDALFDPSPFVLYPDKREEMEQFIDQVLDAYAG